MPLPKIFVDFNNRDLEGRVRLTNGSYSDISRMNIQLRSGFRVILDDSEGLSIEGTVEFSDTENVWVAKYDHQKLNGNSPF
jgi:hypothetical protein